MNINAGENTTLSTTATGDLMDATSFSITSIDYTTVSPEPTTKVIEGPETYDDFSISNVTLSDDGGNISVSADIANTSVSTDYYITAFSLVVGNETITFAVEGTLAAGNNTTAGSYASDTTTMEAETFSISNITYRVKGLTGPQIYDNRVSISNITVTPQGTDPETYNVSATITNMSNTNDLTVDSADFDLFANGTNVASVSIDTTGTTLQPSGYITATTSAPLDSDLSSVDDFAITSVFYNLVARTVSFADTYTDNGIAISDVEIAEDPDMGAGSGNFTCVLTNNNAIAVTVDEFTLSLTVNGETVAVTFATPTEIESNDTNYYSEPISNFDTFVNATSFDGVTVNLHQE